MAWFRRDKTQRPKPDVISKIPDGLWTKCEKCREILYEKELVANLKVCPKCDYHFKMGSIERFKSIFDENSWEIIHNNILPADPLKFKDTKRYKDRLKAFQAKTGFDDAAINAVGAIDGKKVIISAMEFTFIGGSMGSVVGEKVTLAIEKAKSDRIPLFIISSSGGARMQEGMLSLMQMAKTSAALAQLSSAGVLFISVLTNPTMAGVMASYAMLGDIIIAEPGAMIGFTGPRVIEQTIGKKLPEGFQSAEFLMEHGFLDMIVPRNRMRKVFSDIIRFWM